MIESLAKCFSAKCQDKESNACIIALAETELRWPFGHQIFIEIRDRLLRTERQGHRVLAAQYFFEEVCAKSVYNLSDPPDPFDPDTPIFVAVAALQFAESKGLGTEDVVRVLQNGGL